MQSLNKFENHKQSPKKSNSSQQNINKCLNINLKTLNYKFLNIKSEHRKAKTSSFKMLNFKYIIVL